MTSTITPAVWYARIFGIVLTLAGIAGLAVITDQNSVQQLAGLDINLTHNIVHLLTGVLGLVAGFAVLTSARYYALVLGIVYAGLGLWGVIVGDGFNPFGLFENINMADNVLHLVIGIVGLGAWAMSRTEVRQTTV